ncbi:hypothetical protein ACIPYQ_39685 [Streptomyces sp. NPDC090045]|uniref:hypothetical protein n=1 Tax=Streptomyces sp. NPDC090045 TaxID=3365927 RepID=UPI00380E58D9
MTTTALPPAAPTMTHTGLAPAAVRRLAIAERVLYGAGGILTAVGPQTDVTGLHVAALAAGAGTLAVLWRRTRVGGAGLLLACARALPVLGLSGTYAAALIAPGCSWWEIAAPVAVATAAGLAAPLTRAAGISRAVANLPAVAEETDAGDYLSGVRALWAVAPAAKGTELTGLHQGDPYKPAFTAVILAAPGEAVSSRLDERAVAAIFDVPEAAVLLNPIPGSGPGRLALLVDPARAEEHAAREADPVRALWTEKVSGPGGIAPGMNLADYRLEDGKAVFRVESDDDRLISIPRLPLARALGVEDPDLLMVEAGRLSTAVVTIYREHPLIHIREATREDLTMRADGTFALGLRHDGRPARMKLYDPELGGLADILVGAPGSGKSVTMLTILAAERLSGVVSIVADAQDGMSLPEAKGRTYHFGAGKAALAATLAGADAVARYRENISAANGWGSFTRGEPWSLVNISLDEINQVLAEDAEVTDDFRKWVVAMVARALTTYRKLGMGLRIAGQSIHLADLGDSDKIRAGARRGSVWLGRVDSEQTQRMASSMKVSTVEVTPIPPYFGGGDGAEVEAAWAGEETPTGPVTAGMAWHISGGAIGLMRVWRAVKEQRTYPGLIRLMESAPLPGLTPEEDRVFRAAYEHALRYAEDMLEGTGGLDREALNAELETVVDALDAHHAAGTDAGLPVGMPRPPAKAQTLGDLIVDALGAGPMRTRDIRAAVGVGTTGGPSAASVETTISRLSADGRIVKGSTHGTWALPGGPQD